MRNEHDKINVAYTLDHPSPIMRSSELWQLPNLDIKRDSLVLTTQIIIVGDNQHIISQQQSALTQTLIPSRTIFPFTLSAFFAMEV